MKQMWWDSIFNFTPKQIWWSNRSI